MVSRRELKEAHENSVLSSFAEYLKEQGVSLTVKTQPDPPDAFVVIDSRETWIEITDAFYDQATAISITSYAADDVRHRPSGGGGLVSDPTEKTNQAIEAVISEKLTKATMNSIATQHGKGILLVGLFGPFFDVDDAEQNLTADFRHTLMNQTVFDKIYLYEPTHEGVHKYKKIL